MQPIQINRRKFIAQLSGIAAASQCAWGQGQPESRPSTTRLGLVIYCRRIRRDALRAADPSSDLYHPNAFLDECLRLGAGGIQANLNSLSDQAAREFRLHIEETGRFVEAIVRLPKTDSDLKRFEIDVRRAILSGAKVARTTIIPGRRYEQFDSYAEFMESARLGEQMVVRALPVLERHGLVIAIENHKDQRNDERLQLFERISSEYVGACVDTGNSVALLEDPLETVQTFAPWARSVHLKDQAVQRTPDGFLLADVPLGKGCLPLKAMVDTIVATKPKVQFSLELITRDPLHVPCLTNRYRRVFKELDAADLARAIKMVESGSAKTLPLVSTLSPHQQLQVEDQNVVESLRYASNELNLRA